jgi:hypothetical protein
MNSDRRPTAVRVDRRSLAVGLVAALVLVGIVLVRPDVLLPGGAHAGPTPTSVARTTATPTATPPPSPSIIMGTLSQGRQVDPLAPVSGDAQMQLTAAQRQLLATRRNWRTGLIQTTQPAHLPVPQVAGFAVGVTHVPGIIIDPAHINFDGLNAPANASMSPAGAVEPGQGLCVSATSEIQLMNPAVGFYDRSGNATAQPIGLNALFGEPASFIDADNHQILTYVTDPRCYYDAITRTWFASALVLGLNLDTSAVYAHTHLDLALNRASDPRTPWTVYQVDATDDGSGQTPRYPGCPCLGDRPLLGVDAKAVYLTANEFTLAGTFTGADIYAIDKAALLSGASQVNMAQFHNLAVGGALAASIQPATLVGNPGAEFFMSALDPSGTTDNRLGIWAMTNEGALGQGAPPSLTSTMLTTETYGQPPSAGAAQRGSSVLLDTGDDRMQQVEFRNGQLYTALATAILPNGDTVPRAGVAWFDVTPRVGSGSVLSASVVAQGYIAVRGASLLAPDLGVAWDGDMAVVATLVGAGYYPTAVYTTTHPRGFSPFGPLQIARLGAQPYTGPDCGGQTSGALCAWAGYSTTAWDPTNLNGEAVMWMTTGYVSQAPSGANGNYGTRVFAVGPI